uniref:Uncharacterized protein n=1 Tax=Manihot esculenta TaxID=3983 RepID=A0A2C9UDX8_MANES
MFPGFKSSSMWFMCSHRSLLPNQPFSLALLFQWVFGLPCYALISISWNMVIHKKGNGYGGRQRCSGYRFSFQVD